MVSRNKLIILSAFALAFLFFNSAHAGLDDIIYGVNTINGKAISGENLAYNITLRNNGIEPLNLSFNVLTISNVQITPKMFEIQPNEEKIVNLMLTIKPEQHPGKILINFLVFDDAGNSLEPPIYIQGEVLESPQPFAAVKINSVSIEPAQIDPREPISVSFQVSNPVKETVATLEITSDIPGFERYYDGYFNLNDGTFTETIDGIMLPENTSPGDHTFTVKIIFSDEITSSNSVVSEVVPYSTCNIEKDESVSLLGKTYSAKIKNIGTEATTCVVEAPVSKLESKLISSITDGSEFDGTNVIWEIQMGPGMESVVSYHSSYLPILLIPFAFILIIAGFWFITRKVSVTKEIADYKRYHGAMDLKVQVKVKNLSNSELKHVKIYDPLPIFIKEVTDFGTAHGKMIKKGKEKVVFWDLEHLKPKEERIFSYKARTSLEILGEVVFNPTKVEYTLSNGKKKEDSSNALVVDVE